MRSFDAGGSHSQRDGEFMHVSRLYGKIVRKLDSGIIMSELIQVRKKSQVTLPQSIRQELGIKEGDYLDIQVRDGEIVLKAKVVIDKQQAWFWSERWQQGEAEAQEDIRTGNTHKFADAASAIDFLHAKTSKRSGKADKRRK